MPPLLALRFDAPGIIIFGEDDSLLHPWVTAQVASKLRLDPASSSMHELVCAHVRKNGRREDVCIEIDELLEKAAPEPGPLLRIRDALTRLRAASPWQTARRLPSPSLGLLDRAVATGLYFFKKKSGTRLGNSVRTLMKRK